MNKFNVPDLSYLTKQKEMAEKKKVHERDIEYADKFWDAQGNDSNHIERIKSNMQEIILDCVQKGQFAAFISLDEKGKIDERSKKHLSAYRVLAGEMGYEIGNFLLNKESGTAIADIKKKDAS